MSMNMPLKSPLNLSKTAIAVCLSSITLLSGCGSSSDTTAQNVIIPDTTAPVITATTVAKTFTSMNTAGDTNITAGIDSVACTKDNTTQLVWEVKSDEAAGLTQQGEDFRDKDYGYNWYNGQSGSVGLPAGTAATASVLGSFPCQQSGTALTSCNTNAYINAVNTMNGGKGLCGFTNWRLPTTTELLGIMDTTRTSAPFIYSALGSTATDPETLGSSVRGYWSSEVSSTGFWKAVSFSLKEGNRAQAHSNSSYNYVRLVRQ